MNRLTFRIGTKLAIAVLVPLLLAIGLAGYSLLEKWNIRSEMMQVGRLVDGIVPASRLVHELQRERGMSGIVLSSKGTQMRAELAAQRQRSITRQTEFGNAVAELRSFDGSPAFTAAVTAAVSAVAGLDRTRQAIDALSIPPGESFARYTETIDKLLIAAGEISKASRRGDVSTAIAAYVNLIQGKERAGQERATGAAGLAAGKFEPAGYVRVLGLRSAQVVYFGLFEAGASPAQATHFRQTVAGKAVDDVARMREIIAGGGLSGQMPGLDAKTWFDTTTTRIDLIKTVEDRVAEDLKAQAAAIQGEAAAAVYTVAGIIAAAMTVSIVVVIAIAGGLTRILGKLTVAMRALGQGQRDVEVPGRERGDEIGEIARAVDAFKIKAEERAREEAEIRFEQDRVAAEQRHAEMHKLADGFERTVGGIVAAVSSASAQLETAAGILTETAANTERLSGTVSAASREASGNVQSVAAATEELSASVNEISRQVLDSSRIAGEAVHQADKANGRVAALSEATGQIGEVVKLINAIAEQTNLLALNATIEAARAGVAGKGFAVVASEVKALAGQTGKATEEIVRQIAGMQTATHDSVAAIKEIGDTIDHIASISGTIAAAVEQQDSVTRQIARDVSQAAHGTGEVTANIAAVSRGAGETGSASSQVLSAAQALARESVRLQTEMEQFIATVRAA